MRQRLATMGSALALGLGLFTANASATIGYAGVQDPPASKGSTTTTSTDSSTPNEATDEGAHDWREEVKDGKVVLGGVTFEVGPCVSKLGTIATIQVPDGMLFTDGDGARRTLEQSQNLTSGRELGMIVAPSGRWSVYFEFDQIGYVKDDEKDKLDADALLENFQEGVEHGNEERERRGWDKLQLVGWHKAPFYDQRTNNLTWSLLIAGKDQQSVNWSTRLLGRSGTMDVDLVLSPDQVDTALPEFEKLLDGFQFVQGQTYGEFRAGDKVAEIGLAALVAGGAGAVAFKTGLLAKFWKFILAGVVAVGAFFKRIFGFGKKDGERNADA